MMFGSVFPGEGNPCQTDVMQDARPSVTDQFRGFWRRFIEQLHEDDPIFAGTVRELEARFRVQLVLSSPDDVNAIGHVPFLLARYVSGGADDLWNFVRRCGFIIRMAQAAR